MGAWIDGYMGEHTVMKPERVKSYRITRDKLVEYFGQTGRHIATNRR